MACNPPYCFGTGGCGNCSCRCCPPDPCYTSWRWEYLCGTPYDAWDGPPPPNAGCVCPSPALPFIASSLGIEFPDFDPNELKKGFKFAIDESEYVMALSGPCTIPCQTTVITLTTTGCCFVKDPSSDMHFWAVGDGVARLTISGRHRCNHDFSIDLNGDGESIFVNDCDEIWVHIFPPSDTCCSCCKSYSEGTLLGGGGSYRIKKTTSAVPKLVLNRSQVRQALINRIAKKG